MSENCEKKSLGAQLISQKIFKVLGNENTETASIIELKNLSTDFTSLGGIDDIISISEKFFSEPVEDIPVENLILADPEKTFGKFKVSDLSDNPGLDITKAFNLSEKDLEKIEKIKFSISTPTIEIVKSFKLGLITTKIKFSITKKDFTFLPVIDQGVDTKEKAIEKLKGIKVNLPLEISKVTLDEAKKIASDSYKNSIEVQNAIKNSLTKEDFFQQMNSLGIVLFKEVNIEDEVNNFLKLEEDFITGDDTDCGYPDMVPAPFNPEELLEIEKDCCGKESSPETIFEEDLKEKEEKFKEAEKALDINLDDNLSKEKEEELLNSINNLLNSTNKSNEIMQKCSNERANALNNFYFFLEAKLLNEIALKYVEERAFMLDSLKGTLTSLVSSRNQLIEKSKKLKERENSLFTEAYNRIVTVSSLLPIDASGITSGKTINGVFISSYNLSLIEKDDTFVNSVSSIRKDIKRTEDSINKLTSTIESQKRNFQLPEFSESELLNIRSISSSEQTSILSQKTNFFRDVFSINNNLLSNQVGYNSDKQSLKLLIHPLILDEAKTLFALNSPEVGDVSFYIDTLQQREKEFGNKLWNKFYSASRIDQLFTYLEQGYTSPKPSYSATGQQNKEKKTVKIPNALGDEIEQEVDSDILNLDVNREIALEFWQNLEQKTYQKILIIIEEIKSSETYINYIKKIVAAAHNEAKYSFATGLVFQESSYTFRKFENDTNTFNFNYSVISSSLIVNANTTKVLDSFSDIYSISYESIKKFQDIIENKLDELQAFIEEKKKCIADEEQKIEATANNFSQKSNIFSETEPETPQEAQTRDICQEKLGSDPYGFKSPSDCPSFVKNCYWKEYTKLIQLVSLMPIPDTQFLNKRLFRYYPVAIKIPVPVPPGVLPTLASGIPDPFISIPLPILWKHIISVYTPAGVFVIWVTLTGPIPGVYILYIDEKNEPCFLMTPKGPISVPAKSLGVSDAEEKSLLEFLPIKDFFKVNLGIPPFNKLMGSSKIKLGDSDDPKTFIDKIQSKIKSAVDSLNEYDPDYKDLTGTEEEIKLKRKNLQRIKNAFKKFPPDIEAISFAFQSIEKIIDKSVDSIKITPIKYPNKAENLAIPPIGPSEFLDQINKMVDSGVNLPDLGLGIKIFSLRKELRLLLDRKLPDASVKTEFEKINTEIGDLEEKLSTSNISEEEKILERTKIIKKAIKVPITKVADEIDPGLLGFVSLISVPLPSPEPCYDSSTVEPIPSYILAVIGAIKQLPNLVNSISEEDFAKSLSKFLNLSAPLPRIEDVMFFAFNSFINFTPDLKFPDTKSISALKQVIATAAMSFFKIKIRPPRPGAIQVVITDSMIKSILKTSIKAVFATTVKLIIDELLKAVENKDVAMILGIAAIIKGLFGTDLGNLSGSDIKSFLSSSLETVSDQLNTLESFLIPVQKIDFKSIKEQLFPTLPPKLNPNGPFLEVGTQEMVALTTPLLRTLSDLNLPYPLLLLGCTTAPSRLVLSKIYPFAAKEILPTWEKLSLKNIPFVIWLDQLVASAQRQGGLGSDYVAPYYLPDLPV